MVDLANIDIGYGVQKTHTQCSRCVGRALPNSVQIGAAIRMIRKAKRPKVSIEALALVAGMDKSYLTDIELLNRNPSWETLRVVVEALEIDLGDLVDVALAMPPHATPEADESVS